MHSRWIGLVFAASVSIALTPALASASEHKVLELPLVNGALHEPGRTVRFKQGDEVELRWSSDRPVTLHLHGYDIESKVAPDKPAVMSFKATIPGRFPVEVHGQRGAPHRAVLYLEVYP